jgi:hypothetical protein
MRRGHAPAVLGHSERCPLVSIVAALPQLRNYLDRAGTADRPEADQRLSAILCPFNKIVVQTDLVFLLPVELDIGLVT